MQTAQRVHQSILVISGIAEHSMCVHRTHLRAQSMVSGGGAMMMVRVDNDDNCTITVFDICFPDSSISSKNNKRQV